MKTKVLTVILISMLSMVALVACGGAETPVSETRNETPQNQSNTEVPVNNPPQEDVSEQTPESTPVPEVKMPDVRDLHYEEAIIQLLDLNMNLNIVLIEVELVSNTREFDGLVSQTEPRRNTILNYGDTVELWYTPLFKEEEQKMTIEDWMEIINKIEINFEVTEEVYLEYWNNFLDELTIIYDKFYTTNEIDEDEYINQLNELKHNLYLYVWKIANELKSELNNSEREHRRSAYYGEITRIYDGLLVNCGYIRTMFILDGILYSYDGIGIINGLW